MHIYGLLKKDTVLQKKEQKKKNCRFLDCLSQVSNFDFALIFSHFDTL